MRRNYEEVIGEIQKNAKDVLSENAHERTFKRVEGCFLALLCELLLDIRESLGTGTIIPCCEEVEE